VSTVLTDLRVRAGEHAKQLVGERLPDFVDRGESSSARLKRSKR